MIALRGGRVTLIGAAAFLAIATTGCATKKHVSRVMAPVEARVSETEKKVAGNSTAISELENGLSRADERAMDADKKAVAAGTEASRANERATQAGQRADEARQAADRGLAKVAEVEKEFDDTIQKLDSYKPVGDATVLFKFNRSALTKEGKEQLDQAVGQLQNMRAYVVEVHGFTDRIGSKDYNLELSRKRANEVVRYLNVAHNIPLRRIHVIGIGSEKPAEEGKTRAANQANRRVEVKVFAPEYAVAGMSTPGATPQQQTPATQQPGTTTPPPSNNQ